MGESKLILVIMAGESAENASFSLAKMLEARGHRIIFLAPHWRRNYIESQGFTFHTFELPEQTIQQAVHGGNHFKNLSAYLHQSLFNRDYVTGCAEEWFEAIQPDLVLLDAKMLEYTVPILRKKIPVINLNANLSSFYAEGRPPVYSTLFPNTASHLHSRLAWYKLFLVQHLGAFREKLVLSLRKGTGKYKPTPALVKNAGGEMARTEYGLRLTAPEIVLGPKNFDFPAKASLMPRYYAGICVYEKRTDYECDLSGLHPDKPLIYCSLGTHSYAYTHAIKFHQCLLQSMENLPEYQLVLQSDIFDQQQVPTPPNVKIFSRVPQLELLERARLFITHGGFSSIRESILKGTPMIVFPGWHDQPGNAARVVYHGIGMSGDMKKITPPALTSLIKEVINNASMQQAINKMQAVVTNSNELELAVRFIESYC